MPTFKAIGRQAGEAVVRLLAGTAAPDLALPEIQPSTLNLDWRAIRR